MGPSELGVTPLHTLAVAGAEPGLVQLLVEHRADPNQQCHYGWSPEGVIHFIISLPHRCYGSKVFMSMVMFHLKKATPLMVAVMLGKHGDALELLRCRASAEMQNGRGKTAL